MLWFIHLVLDWLLSKLLSAISVFGRDVSDHQAEVEKAHADVQPAKDLKPDSTAKDVDDAIDSELGHF